MAKIRCLFSRSLVDRLHIKHTWLIGRFFLLECRDLQDNTAFVQSSFAATLLAAQADPQVQEAWSSPIPMSELPEWGKIQAARACKMLSHFGKYGKQQPQPGKWFRKAFLGGESKTNTNARSGWGLYSNYTRKHTTY